MNSTLVLGLIFVLISFHSFALSQSKSPKEQDSLHPLSAHSQWLALLHYRHSFWGNFRSDVLSQDFFLAKDGRENPEAELVATIEQLRSPVTGDPNQHVACRFPARRLWLKSIQVPGWESFVEVDCANYRQFSMQGAIESVSLVFATGYLSNPASFFGHPLLKFNLSRNKVANDLLDSSVNYGAKTPPRENPFVYAGKGLFGGYDATFTNRQFYYNTHAYGEIELRDMWEYQLNLTPSDVQMIVAHTWELLGKNFPYYFFTNNCASAMAEMIRVITGQNVLPKYIPYALPYTLFDNLYSAQAPNGSPLVRSTEFLPSRQTRLNASFGRLSSAQKEAVRSVARSNQLTSEFFALTPVERSPTIEALFDYYSFRSSSEQEKTSYAGIKRELLLDRLKLPASELPAKSEPHSPDLAPPHQGQRPFLTRIAAVSSARHNGLIELRVRPAYYDFLALDSGRPKNSSVRVLDAIANFSNSRAWLRRLDLLAIDTLNLSQTGLPGDGGYAWKFNLGFENQSLACTDCMIAKLESGIGKAVSPFKGHVWYAMLDGRVQSATDDVGHLAIKPWVGALIDVLPSGFWRMELSIGYLDALDDRRPGEWMAAIENRLGTSRVWDIRVGFEQHVDRRWFLAYSRYW